MPGERDALLQAPRAGSTAPRLRRWRTENVVPADLVVPLMVITFATSAMDVATFQDFGVYTTNQTGLPSPCPLLGPRQSPHSRGRLARRLSRGRSHHGPDWRAIRTKAWLSLSMAIQIVTLLGATLLAAPFSSPDFSVGGRRQWVVVLLTAAGGGTQIAMASSAGVAEIPTGMMTTPYARFISEPHLLNWRVKDAERDRRAAYVAVFWAGALVGGALVKWVNSWSAFALGLVAKLVALAMLASARLEIDRHERLA